MDIAFFEQPTGDIRVYLESQFELSGFVHSVHGGISEFFTFIDGHFTRRLTEHTADSHGEESAIPCTPSFYYQTEMHQNTYLLRFKKSETLTGDAATP